MVENLLYKLKLSSILKNARVIYSIYCNLALKRLANNCASLQELVDLSYEFKCFAFTIKPIQIRKEITILLQLVSRLKPKRLLEIGTANGGTLFLFSRIAAPDAIIISIDLPGGPFGGGYPRWKIPFYKSFKHDNQEIYLIRANSHDPNTLKRVRGILSGRKLDFLFIGGDHTYEGVKKDFEMYSPLVRKGGIIAFHDIVPDYYTRYGVRTSSQTGGVSLFWQEIKTRYKHLEIIKDPNQDGYGIGVIYV